ncbi:aminopeptidase N [Ordospora colligata OC4]|uniref:Aminopeptidase N n=1 Tax=Ordospora colligata OC4 TaxID=1354746 RepID=A0A0B2UHJ6_9MICR|nr:aminopeptidase N [Ordospora colligata OC4]KHN68778.1 aminopeptidase N [Ordospora colligata OC4]TBU13770.1 aminopeptidase N [Ordospora colligata]
MAFQVQHMHDEQHTHYKHNNEINNSHINSISTEDVLRSDDVLYVNDREVLDSNVIPQHYDLRIKIMDAGFGGAVGIAIDIKNATRSIVLNAVDLEISNVKLIAGGIHHVGTVQPDLQLNMREQIKIVFTEDVKGPAYIVLQFSGTYSTGLRGLYCITACTNNHSITNDSIVNTGIERDESNMNDRNTQQCSRVYCTHFEPSDARRMFPCFDQPDMKATFSISVDVSKTLVVLSNTDAVDELREEYGDRKIEYFERTCRMATYVVAILAGSLDYVEGVSISGIRVRVYGVTGVSDKQSRKYALEIGLKSVEYFGEYLGMRYVSCGSSAKIDMVGVPEFGAGAMENWGLVVYRTENLEVMAAPEDVVHGNMTDVDKDDRNDKNEGDKNINGVDDRDKNDGKDDKKNVMNQSNNNNKNNIIDRDKNIVDVDEDNMQQIRETVSHEIAHMWFGNLVTLRWWDELWVNEGFATWASLKCLQEGWGADEELRFVKDRLASSMREEGNGRAVRDKVMSGASAAGRFDSVRYGKSASVIRMVEKYVGVDVMRDGIKIYLKKHKYGNVSGSEVWKAVGECWKRIKRENDSVGINEDSNNDTSGTEISQMVREWMEQEGYPVVHAYEKDGAIVLTQSRYCSSRMNEEVMNVNNKSDESRKVNEVVDIGNGKSMNKSNRLSDERVDKNNYDVGCDIAKHLWRIPVGIMWEDGSIDTVLLSTSEKRVVLRTQRYKLNAGYAGYFRVHYETDGGVLNALMVSGDSEIDQANVIEDVFELAYAGYMSVGAVMRDVLLWGITGPWRWGIQQKHDDMKMHKDDNDEKKKIHSDNNKKNDKDENENKKKDNDNNRKNEQDFISINGIEMLNEVKMIDDTDRVGDGLRMNKMEGEVYKVRNAPDNVVKGVVGKLLVVWGELYEDVEVRQVIERAIWEIIGKIVEGMNICVEGVNNNESENRKSDWNPKKNAKRMNGYDRDCIEKASSEMQKYALEVGVMMGRQEAVEKARNAYERGTSRIHMPAMVGAVADERIEEMMQRYAGAGKEWRKWVIEGMSGLMKEKSVKYVLDEVCKMSRLCMYMNGKCEDGTNRCANNLDYSNLKVNINSSDEKNQEVNKEEDRIRILRMIADGGVVDKARNVVSDETGEILDEEEIGIADIVDILRGIWRGGKFREMIAEYVLRMWGEIQKAAGMNGMILRDAAEMVGGIRNVSVGVKYGDEQKGKDWELAGKKVIEEIRFRERLRERRDEILKELMTLFDSDEWKALESS